MAHLHNQDTEVIETREGPSWLDQQLAWLATKLFRLACFAALIVVLFVLATYGCDAAATKAGRTWDSITPATTTSAP